MAVGNFVKRIQQKMRKDAGVNGDAQRIEQMVWMIFLKVYDAQEYEWEIDAEDNGETYQSIIPEPLRWRNWAPSRDENGMIKSDFMTGEKLLNFVNNTLFPVLQGKDSLDGMYKGIHIDQDSKRHEAIVQEVFNEANQYMKNGQLLRDVIDIVDGVDLMDNEESHAFGDIYEGILRDLQAAGNAGEFYTPRAVTDFTVEKLDPRLGELMGDLACGTCGFLVSGLNYLEKQKKTAHDEELFQQSVMGQEWKPFPYLLGVTNIILHGIKEPMMHHMDSLSHPMSDYMEDGKLNVIAMNPPFGGATDDIVQKNFKLEFRSGETADLFMVLIMQRLAENGRAGVVLPDGFLFGTEGTKLAIKTKLLRDFNLHTIIRLPASVFAPYASLATNILFFNNERADDAPEGFATAKTWFYRLDMPEGYKHFSKTKRMLAEHFNPVREWWDNRQELEDCEKSRAFTPQELIDLQCNFDQCKFPKDEEEVLSPEDLMTAFLLKSDGYIKQIRESFANIHNKLNGNPQIIDKKIEVANPWRELSDISVNLPERLKKSILQEAIMGKLGTQDPNDEPASVLHDRILEEKKKLVKAGVLKRKDIAETPVEEDEIPFDIPDNWMWIRFGDLVSTYPGKTPARGDSTYWGKNDYPWVSISDMRQGEIIEKTKEFVSTKAAEECFHGQISKKGTLLMSFMLTVGRTSILGIDAYHNEAIISIKTYADNDNYTRNYLSYILPLVANSGDSKDAIKGKTLNSTSIYNLFIPLPPQAEQHRIVEKIEALFAEIDHIEI